MLDQLPNQLCLADSGRLKQHRVHADRRKSGHCVYFIKYNVAVLRDKEIDPCKPIAVYRFKYLHGAWRTLSALSPGSSGFTTVLTLH